jgi:hypothetical protein
MLSVLTQLFSAPAQASGKNKLYAREINLSDNIFHFSMPEDFSRDMPAANMVETLDISNAKKFDDPEYGNLIRRWWDIKEPGWFGKKLGTVMMDISVQRVVQNKKQMIHNRPYDVQNRFDFMLMLDDGYHQRYDALNQEMGLTPEGVVPYYSSFSSMLGRRIFSNQREHTLNGQKWVQQTISGPRSDLITILSIPITNDVYLEASFTYSANSNVSYRNFVDTTVAKMAIIQKTFQLNYSDGNPFAKIVGEDWLEQTNDEVLEQHRDAILKLFYGPDPEAAMLESERQGREARERDEREIREVLKHDPL